MHANIQTLCLRKEGMSYNIYLAGGIEIVWTEILKSKGMMIGNYYETICPR